MPLAYLSLGSNLGDRQAHLRATLDRLPAPGVRVVRVSPIYETEPVDFTDQPWFLNLVAEVETSLAPADLLAHTQQIEAALGRQRTVPKGPRTVDIDILLYGDRVVHSATLEIPHPSIHERRFVLAPLADLAPDLRHPLTGRTVREMLDAAPAAVVRRVGDLG